MSFLILFRRCTFPFFFSCILQLLLSISFHPDHCLADAFILVVPPRNPTINTRTTITRLYATKHRSARDQERRDEDQRRKTRAKDVILGQTSAVPGATDYALNTQQTEQEYIRNMTPEEKLIYQCTEQGMEHFKMLRLDEAVQSFQQVFALKPDAYLWQAGMALYYVNEYEQAADRLAQCARIYETKFGQPATEERIWWYACQLQYRHQGNNNSNNNTTTEHWTPLPYVDDTTDQLLASETRKVVKLAHELFRAAFQGDQPHCGASSIQQQEQQRRRRPDPKLWKLHAWFYLGLYYDAVGDVSSARQCMKCALLLTSSGNGSDLIHVLPMLQMSRRDWFDDEDITTVSNDGSDSVDENNDALLFQQITVSQTTTSSTTATATTGNRPPDPYFVQSLRAGLEEMRYYDLKDALRAKGMPGLGSKAELVQTLLQSVLTEAGFV